MLGRVLAAALLPVLSLGQECGRSNLRELHRGKPGEVGEGNFPSACTLATEINQQRVFMGGASLISRNQLVTLATLVSGVQGEEDTCTSSTTANLMVVCGTVDLQAEHGEEVQVRKVARVLIHPDYKARSLTNDIAVLLLEEPVDYTETVAQVCLPRPDKYPPPRARCVAVGHGKEGPDSSGNPSYNRILHQVNLPLWRPEDCQRTLNRRHFQLEYDMTWRIHSSHLCAGGEEDQDTCTGDGGGPLLCLQEKDGTNEGSAVNADAFDLRGLFDESVSLIQAGITAWGIGCGRTGIPGVYTDLASAACWLDQVMSCYPANKFSSGLVDLRSPIKERPPSALGLTEGECLGWHRSLQFRAFDPSTACGCRPTLVGERGFEDYTDSGLSAADLDLRRSDF